jgi:hypothetical protein
MNDYEYQKHCQPSCTNVTSSLQTRDSHSAGEFANGSRTVLMELRAWGLAGTHRPFAVRELTGYPNGPASEHYLSHK